VRGVRTNNGGKLMGGISVVEFNRITEKIDAT
jgi:hypothetical protein